ncbi:MAG: hypothetical protein KTR29_13130 [Rhodothermaceae bacterium]|nr:hypothetical protein [Rhodothermaceae bacterium]
MKSLSTTLIVSLLAIGCGEFVVVNLNSFQIQVVSSPEEYVSGDAARIEVHVPDGVIGDSVSIRVNDEVQDIEFIPTESNSLEAVLKGLSMGQNTVTARMANGKGYQETSIIVTNHSSVGPMFSGPAQTPFMCTSENHKAHTGLGDVLDDNCSMETVVSFLYKPQGVDDLVDFDPALGIPSDVDQTVTLDGKTVDYIVRWERGTINRFIYSIALLSPSEQIVDSPDLSAWNERLIYYFQGGVGIGRYQGNPNRQRMLYDYGLANGYAVIYSTGTRTSTHYDLEVGGETAIMTKDRFVTAYGKPMYTVGVGGSGGGIQQYVYGQNHEGLLDAGIPQYSYPDMVTQTIHVGDCELLERYMDTEVLLNPDSKWATWSNRQWLEGLNASNSVLNPFTGNQPGSTECIKGWRGLTPLTFNPHYGTAPGISQEEQVAVEWTHYADLEQIYGTDEHGYARRTWDNKGVQYGLQALRDQRITMPEFLDLNARAGGWKPAHESVQEAQPYIDSATELDIHSARNMTLSPDDSGYPAAPRTTADPEAVRAAYENGLVFTGELDIPLIDWRHYLEAELDMHNAHQSFSSRQRMLNHDGDASNQVVWFTDASTESARFDQTPMAFEVIDKWMENILANPGSSVHDNKPERAVDSCFDLEGNLIYAGGDAWSGILDSEAPGTCTEKFPLYSTSRIVAGGPITGDIFKCALQSVEDAIKQGVYGSIELSSEDKNRLQEIFPEGVCDYSQGDIYKPTS